MAQHSGLMKRSKRRIGISRSMLLCSIFAAVYFLLDWWILSSSEVPLSAGVTDFESQSRFFKEKRSNVMYDRLLALAAHSLAEADSRSEPHDLWTEPASAWKPCANVRRENHTLPPAPENSTGYILINANGGLNQQRVAICNAVAISRLLNATLVLPSFMLSNVWQDESQFGDIYQEEYFVNYLREDVYIVKSLPIEMQSLDLQAIGSFLSELDVMKESKPGFYIQRVLPILLRNRVVYFSGFGNRLSFDPIPFEIQRLRCRCNFHALRFRPEIQAAGDLLVQRIHQNFPGQVPSVTRYLALHLRFEIDMVAYSMCDFGGGEPEKLELQAYRDVHFPMMAKYHNETELASTLRELGQCPLSPEEGALILAALGFKRGTRVFLAGAQIYGGQSRLTPLSTLYPNLVTKEDLLSEKELSPFANHSSQLAALDFIACTAADVFAMTDSGSQLASLVSGYRMYFGGGRLPIIRPNKKRLVSLFAKNSSIQWGEFRERVRKTIRENRKVHTRPTARSVYRHPRCEDCMCQAKE
ncbi:O-fucosyltransferase 15 [Selaginella moellendorffii]|nr:O-fucosyltransferase 15 [Selaginella moellendorffii]|eukprot:XP_002966670.2 O-fucosyltransferase 15 [Selaginella moellendorffii]